MTLFTFFRLLFCCASVLGLLSCIHVREAVYLDIYQGEPIPFEEMIDIFNKSPVNLYRRGSYNKAAPSLSAPRHQSA